jgi:hypothetical protein
VELGRNSELNCNSILRIAVFFFYGGCADTFNGTWNSTPELFVECALYIDGVLFGLPTRTRYGRIFERDSKNLESGSTAKVYDGCMKDDGGRTHEQLTFIIIFVAQNSCSAELSLEMLS